MWSGGVATTMAMQRVCAGWRVWSLDPGATCTYCTIRTCVLEDLVEGVVVCVHDMQTSDISVVRSTEYYRTVNLIQVDAWNRVQNALYA